MKVKIKIDLENENESQSQLGLARFVQRERVPLVLASRC